MSSNRPNGTVAPATAEPRITVMHDMTEDRSGKKSVRHTLQAVASIIRSQPKRIRFHEVDVEDLRQMVALRDVVEEAIGAMVQGLTSDGYSWSEVARPLGVTRQEAHRRYRQRAAS